MFKFQNMYGRLCWGLPWLMLNIMLSSLQQSKFVFAFCWSFFTNTCWNKQQESNCYLRFFTLVQ